MKIKQDATLSSVCVCKPFLWQVIILLQKKKEGKMQNGFTGQPSLPI